ncbi:division/cell wall cluster transcriptional repressor MraZ [Croceicoccus sp. YJ47]|uniref:division/cell wall cluster transcriptional repressor MraZ n=1 Tax=Croceicoccus sp. YJ47 TaxID=2798724 RepID=UPI0019245D76|nr:division/cell wall cluster transcriptional repressor MraZ [Croceicoccus sp. YJ47]QQN74757.1 division/cell wall cluster transcriptional repressor MraZ [Croceicoccus sp. YJ47]
MSARPHSYRGQGFSLRGEKNRFVLPPAFRKVVRESSDDARILCLAKHERWDCLTGFGLSRMDELEIQLDREEERALRMDREFDRDTRSAQLYGFLEIPFDESGRFIMPDHLIDLARIEGELFFQGGGAFFTLWNPARLFEMGDDWTAAKAACESLRGDAAKPKRGRK